MPTSSSPTTTTTEETDPTVAFALREVAAGQTVSQVAAQLGVAADTLRHKLIRHPDYARARENQCHALAERCAEIAQGATAETERPARLQIDTLKWLVSKLLPSTYGDKVGDAQEIKLTVEVKRELPDGAYAALPAPADVAQITGPLSLEPG